MVKLKVGRNIIELDEKDLILDNGACYQIGNLTLKECKNLDIKSM